MDNPFVFYWENPWLLILVVVVTYALNRVIALMQTSAKATPRSGNWIERGLEQLGPPKEIPREVQEEIDQAPEWWDREFQKLLRALPGAEGPWDAENAYRARQRDDKEFYRRHRDHEISEDRTFTGVVARYCFDCDLSQCEDEKRRYLSKPGDPLPVMKYAPGGYVDPVPPTTAELRQGEYVLVGFNERGEDVYDTLR